MSKTRYRGEFIVKRLKECLENGELNLTDELKILNLIANDRLKLKTITQAKEQECITYPSMKKRIDNGQEVSIKIAGQTFVCLPDYISI